MTATSTMAATRPPPPTWLPTGDRGVRIDARRALVPGSLGLLAVLKFGLGVPLVALVPLSLLVPGYFAWSTWYVHSHLDPFEQAFNSHLLRGDTDALWRLYHDNRILRFVAPRHVMLSKLGLILIVREDYRRADRVLEEAYDLAPRARRAELLGPLARAKYQLGDFEALQSIAAQWRERSLFPGAANIYLAAAYIEDPREDSEQARALLDELGHGLSANERELADSLIERLGGTEPPRQS